MAMASARGLIKMLIKDCEKCNTSAVIGLDRQIIAMTMRLCPELFVSIADLRVKLGDSVHPYLQQEAKFGLFRAIAARGHTLEINSAWRTIAGQCLLYNQSNKGLCGISIAAMPGNSNHQSAAAIDINDHEGWKPFLLANGWSWLGEQDPVHFDHKECLDIRPRSIKAFQKLWNMANPRNKLSEDGIMGDSTMGALSNSPCEGFYMNDTNIPTRDLMVTKPQQSGRDVLELQKMIQSVAIDIPTNGYFEKQTEAAVKIFQKRYALSVDGVVGEKTWHIVKSIDLGDSGTVVSRA